MTYKAIFVANEFVNIAIEDKKPITQVNVLYMLYFVNASYLVLYNQRLIKEDFFAWQSGAIIPEVYRVIKKYGSSVIEKSIDNTFRIVNDELALSCIKRVYDIFKDKQLFELVSIVKREGGAWDISYKRERHSLIKQDDILQEYKNLIKINSIENIKLTKY